MQIFRFYELLTLPRFRLVWFTAREQRRNAHNRQHPENDSQQHYEKVADTIKKGTPYKKPT